MNRTIWLTIWASATVGALLALGVATANADDRNESNGYVKLWEVEDWSELREKARERQEEAREDAMERREEALERARDARRGRDAIDIDSRFRSPGQISPARQPEAIVIDPDPYYPPRRPERRFDVDVRATRNNYYVGERVRIEFSATHDCKVYIFSTDASGRTRQLFPNYFERDNDIRAGRRYTIPSRSGYSLTAAPPTGRETIHIAAYRHSFSHLRQWHDFDRGDPMPLRSYGPAQMRDRLKGEFEREIRSNNRKRGSDIDIDVDVDIRDRRRSPRAIIVEPDPVWGNTYAEDFDRIYIQERHGDRYYRDPYDRRYYDREDDYYRDRYYRYDPYDRENRHGHGRIYQPDPRRGSAKVQVKTEPSGAAIYIDGYFAGESPMTVRVEPGRRQVVVYHPGYGTKTAYFNLSDDEKEKWSVRLR